MGASAGKEGFHQCKNLVSTCTGEVSVRETAGKSYKYRTNEDATDWENKMDEFVQKMENVTMQRETDDDFPEDDTMLGVMSNEGWMVRWVPAELAPALNKIPPNEVSLYQHMNTKGIADGCGHAWLVAAIAAVCDYPEVIISCFPEQLSSKPSSGGSYTVRVYNPCEDCEESVQSINDVIPLAAMTRRGTSCDNWTPLYIRPGRELFACLLEKACARMLGGYAHLEHGTALFAWAMFTGSSECFAISKADFSGLGTWAELEVTDLSFQDYYRGEKLQGGSDDGCYTSD